MKFQVWSKKMNTKIKTFIVLLILNTTAYSQVGGNFKISKSVIASGGGQSEGGSFALSGTIGQVDASNELAGGSFKLTGGFWAQETVPLPDGMFSDGFEN
jgi:hypothetical protein